MKKIVYLFILCVTFLVGCGSQVVDESDIDNTLGEDTNQQQSKIDNIQAYGVVESSDSKTISVDFHARVDKIYVKAGQKVHKDDKLVEFDISSLQNEINSKQMDLKQINFQLEKSSHNSIKANLELENAKDELVILEKDMVSNTKLYNIGAISESDYNSFKSKLSAKKRQVESLTMNLTDSKSDEVDGDMQKMHTKERLEEQLKLLNDKYEKANFINGNQIVCDMNNAVISDVSVKEGAYVDREINVMTIVNLDTRVVKADIAEEFISKIFVGQKTEITSMAVPEKVYTGKISRIWGTSIKKGGETIVPVEIEIDNLDDKLYMNFSVDVSIDLDSKK